MALAVGFSGVSGVHRGRYDIPRTVAAPGDCVLYLRRPAGEVQRDWICEGAMLPSKAAGIVHATFRMARYTSIFNSTRPVARDCALSSHL